MWDIQSQAEAHLIKVQAELAKERGVAVERRRLRSAQESLFVKEGDEWTAL
jgi:hypothetical protein